MSREDKLLVEGKMYVYNDKEGRVVQHRYSSRIHIYLFVLFILTVYISYLANSEWRPKLPQLQASRSRGAAQQSVAESGECGGSVPHQVILY